MSDQVQGAGTAEVPGVLQPGQAEGAALRRRAHRRLSESLTDEQQRALGMITQGITIRDVGQQLGVHRGTIYRWLKADPYFRAAFNAWQLEQQESCRAALVKAAEEAVVKVVKCIPHDSDLAWRVIKELGLLSRLRPMTVDPSRVEMEIALEDHEEESALLHRIQHEVKGEDEVASPRGDLGRLLRLKSDAECGGSRRSEPPSAAPASEPSLPEELSRA